VSIRNQKMEDAELAFATANTPLYLLRKLRASNTVARIAVERSSFQIFRALSSALKCKPETFKESVLPYVLLVTLSVKQDTKYLPALQGVAAPHHPWFSYCATYLSAGARSTVRQTSRTKRRTKISRSIVGSGRTNIVKVANA